MSTVPTPASPATVGAPLAAVVPLSELYPSPSNPRKHFTGLTDLAQSVARKGIELPLLVREKATAKGRFEIVDGERRYRAAQQAGVQFVPIIRRDTLSDSDVLELQLENAIQRSDLTPLEEARGFKALLKASKATPAEIAKRVSRSERWVADRLRLLDLLPPLQQLLDQGRISIAHADLLAKLKPEDQDRISDPEGRTGLWTGEVGLSDFGPESEAANADPFEGLKPVSVKELEAWIARHVRADIDHLAETAPLEFGRTQGQVAAAEAKPGRGKKVIHITHEHHVRPEVKGEQRVYGQQSWRRADGTVGTVEVSPGKWGDAKTCDHRVLGFVVAGREYATAFDVCIAKDVCQVHWGKEIKAKQQRAKDLAAGKGAEVTKRDQQARQKAAEAEAGHEAARKAVNALFRLVHPRIAEALRTSLPPVTSPEALRFLWLRASGESRLPKGGIETPDALFAAVVDDRLQALAPGKSDSSWTDHGWDLKRLIELAEALKVGTDGIVKQAKAELKAAEPAPAKATKKGGRR